MIYKYNLGVPYQMPMEKTTIIAPRVTINCILDIQMQGDQAVLWAEVSPSELDDQFTIKPVWTGYEQPLDMTYISTVQEPTTGLVYHYYIDLPCWDA